MGDMNLNEPGDQQIGAPVGGKTTDPRVVNVRGCADCPAATYDHDEKAAVCGFNRKLFIPCDEDQNPCDAVPGDCPLWKGGLTVQIGALGR